MRHNVLAKKSPPITLIEHTESLLSVCNSIRKNYPNIPDILEVSNFYDLLAAAVVLHDFGKSASGFQEKWSKWGYRHEIISAAFISHIANFTKTEKQAIGLAVITHHKDISQLKAKYSTNTNNGKKNFQNHLAEIDSVSEYYEKFFSYFQNWLIANNYQTKFKLTFKWNDLIDSYNVCVVWYNKIIMEGEALTTLHSNFGIMLRGLLRACDHLASAGKVEILSSDFKINNFSMQYYNFQLGVSKVKGNLLLSAPTGSGKTEASLLWAQNNRIAGNRLFYILPFNASINAMYNRFQKYFGDEKVGVLHSKAQYFIFNKIISLDNKEDTLKLAREIQDLTKKIFRPIKVLTPFQILKHFFRIKGWETAIAELSNALLIFDEIHAYDPHSMALIIGMITKLKEYNCRFLFLTATFPAFIKIKLQNAIGDSQEFCLDPKDERDNNLLFQKRHTINILEGDIFENIDRINKVVLEGKYIIIICNTVQRAQDVFNLIIAKDKILLHSRFMLKDREVIESKILNNKPRIIVATQVIEVSLDIDYDILFTEPAPIDALLQRFGRINRKGQKDISPIFIFNLGSEYDKYFYDQNRVALTLQLLKNVSELDNNFANQLVQEVYKDGYNNKEEEKFNQISKLFNSLSDNLIPFIDAENNFDFNDLFLSFQVIPVGNYEAEYQTQIEDNNFIEADKYFIPLTIGQGMRLKNLEAIQERTFEVEFNKYKYFVVDCKYDENLGLDVKTILDSGVIID